MGGGGWVRQYRAALHTVSDACDATVCGECAQDEGVRKWTLCGRSSYRGGPDGDIRA